jgi:hypothetical protein
MTLTSKVLIGMAFGLIVGLGINLTHFYFTDGSLMAVGSFTNEYLANGFFRV